MSDDDVVQITQPGRTQCYVAALPPRRALRRIRPAAGVSGTTRSDHDDVTLQRAEVVAEAPARPASAPPADVHDCLSPQTAATLTQMHAVEAELLVRAMIEAAKADGRIDPEERRRILATLKDAGTAACDRQALLAALQSPPAPDEMIARVTSPELAVEVYAASLLAIKDDKPSEQRYLARLAERLGLSAETVAALHARFGDPPPAAPEA